MFCPECGTENPDDARFCGNCRHQLKGNPDTEKNAGSEQVVEIVNPKEATSDLLKYGILAGSLIIPFIGIIMGIIYIVQGETEDKKDVGKLWLIGGIVMMVIYTLAGGSF